MSSIVCSVLDSISNSYGSEFFNNIALSLSKLTNADQCFIASIDLKNATATTQVNVVKQVLQDNFTYTLANTPCAETISQHTYFVNNASTTFPKDKRLSQPPIADYLGVAITDSANNCIGLLVTFFYQSITNKDQVIAALSMLSGRVSAELSHSLQHSQREDEITLLKNQLQSAEKMASLGSLVAGITHEVNTPLGIAITTHSILAGEWRELAEHIKKQDLTISAMNHYIDATESALTMQGENLDRAKKLIENFKATATDQHRLELETINIKDYYQKVISTLHSLLKPQQISLTITGENNITATTYPGVHAQIITNLISNSARHGFTEPSPANDAKNTITIAIKVLSNQMIEVDYRDNGIGLSDDVVEHVFEPFFTTARNKGGIGLGMSIVATLIQEKLQGKISADQQGQGAHFVYSFKSAQT